MTDMTAVFTLILMLLLALVLLAMEVIIPGISVTGFIAVLLIIISVVWCWNIFGPLAGIALLIVTGALAFLIVRLLTRSMKQGKLSRSGIFLNTESAPTVHGAQDDVMPEVGSLGRAVSALHPGGIAQFGEERIHVTAQCGFIEADTEIVVVQVTGTHIVVAAK